VEFPGAPFELPDDEVLPGVRNLPVGPPERIPPHLDGRVPVPLDLDKMHLFRKETGEVVTTGSGR
jgi:hypothetical protein